MTLEVTRPPWVTIDTARAAAIRATITAPLLALGYLGHLLLLSEVGSSCGTGWDLQWEDMVGMTVVGGATGLLALPSAPVEHVTTAEGPLRRLLAAAAVLLASVVGVLGAPVAATWATTLAAGLTGEDAVWRIENELWCQWTYWASVQGLLVHDTLPLAAPFALVTWVRTGRRGASPSLAVLGCLALSLACVAFVTWGHVGALLRHGWSDRTLVNGLFLGRPTLLGLWTVAALWLACDVSDLGQPPPPSVTLGRR